MFKPSLKIALAMKRNNIIFLLISILFLCSCSKKDEIELIIDSGVYKSYKQELSPINAITKNGIVDGSEIEFIVGIPLGSFYGSNIDFFNMDPPVDPLREPTILIDSIAIEKGNIVYFIYTSDYIFESLPKIVSKKGDNIFIKPQDNADVLKFSPRNRVVLVTDKNEAEQYLTMKGKIHEAGFMLTTYTIYVKNSHFYSGTNNSNYLDLDYLRSELQDNDTLIYVKKDTYFRK